MSSKFVTAEEEYKKNKCLKKHEILILQQWLDSEKHLPKLSEFQLILFHHSCFYNIEETKSCIQSSFLRKRNNPGVFKNRNPFDEDLQQQLKSISISMMPQKTSKGYSVIYHKLMTRDYRSYNCSNHIKLLDMTFSLFLHQNGTSEGHILIFDCQNLSLGHMFKLDIFGCKTYGLYLQESLPFRLKELHIINGGTIIGKLLTFCKFVLSKHLLELLHYHDDIEELYDYVPKECLPEDVGGYCESTDSTLSLNIKNIEDSKDFYVEEEMLVFNPSMVEKKSGWLNFWK